MQTTIIIKPGTIKTKEKVYLIITDEKIKKLFKEN